MKNHTLIEQAENLECLLPALMRRLFTLEPDHPATELPLAQLRVCTLLQAGPRSMTMLSEELDLSVSAVTQIADRLERGGLVERVEEPEDRRVRNLRLTALGAAMMRARREARVWRVAQVLEHLPPDSRHAILRAVGALLDACQAVVPERPGRDLTGARLEQ